MQDFGETNVSQTSPSVNLSVIHSIPECSRGVVPGSIKLTTQATLYFFFSLGFKYNIRINNSESKGCSKIIPLLRRSRWKILLNWKKLVGILQLSCKSQSTSGVNSLLDLASESLLANSLPMKAALKQKEI